MTAPTHVEGARVTLRAYTHADAGLVASVVNDPLIPLVTTVPAVGDADSIRAYIDRQRSRAANGRGFQFVIVDRMSGVASGQVGLTYREEGRERASIGYWIAPEHRRRGLATEAVREISGWAFRTSPVDRLELYVEPANEGSWRAAESAGFVREGLLRRWQRVGDDRRDMFMYALIRP